MQRGSSFLVFHFSDASIHRVAIWLLRLGAVLYIGSMFLYGPSSDRSPMSSGFCLFLMSFIGTISLPVTFLTGIAYGMTDVTTLYTSTVALANIPVFDLFVKRKLLGFRRIGGVAVYAPLGATYASLLPIVPGIRIELFVLPYAVWLGSLWLISIAIVLFEFVASRSRSNSPIQSPPS